MGCGLTSPIGDLEVACGKVLLHVLLESLLKELLTLLQLRLLGMLHLQHLLSMLSVQLRYRGGGGRKGEREG